MFVYGAWYQSSSLTAAFCIKKKNMKKGKLIVICGTDGSGKTTQFNLLVQKMKEKGHATETVDFPQYGNDSCYFVERYLNGEYGEKKEVGPYRASLFYALDRYEKSFDMHKYLQAGTHIVSNRYVSASKGHQACEFETEEERDRYLEWLDSIEYGILGIPKPDLNIVLYVPPEIGQQLVEKKTENREYLKDGKTRDLHEADLGHLQKAAKTYREMVDKYDNWTSIDCTQDGRLMTPEEIHALVWKEVEPVLIHEKEHEPHPSI